MIIDFKRKHSFVSPTFLLDNMKIGLIVAFVLTLCSYLFLDESLALSSQTLPPVFQGLFASLGKLFCPVGWTLITTAIFFYIRFVLRREKKSRKFWYVSLSLPLAFLLCKVLQLVFGRANPEWFFTHQEAPFRFFEWNPSFHSFPSVTSITITTFAVALSCIFSKARLPLLIGGFLLSLAPAFATSCFFSDALAGAYLGAFSAQWIFQKVRREVSL